jgi:hypothetical protein
MPLILAPSDYVRWLKRRTDPRDLMRPFPAEPMRMWPISTRVNKPDNDDPSMIEADDIVRQLTEMGGDPWRVLVVTGHQQTHAPDKAMCSTLNRDDDPDRRIFTPEE